MAFLNVPLARRRRPGLWPAAVSGLLLALAMPGLVGWWWLAPVALVPLLSLCAQASPGRAALGGLVASLLHHLVLLYWIVIVLGRYGGVNLVVAGGALLLLALYMSLYAAFWAGFLAWCRQQNTSVSRVVAFWAAPLLWVGLEWCRSWFGTGFPWMDLGYVLAGQPLLLQAADLGGHLLLGFLLVLGNMLLFILWERWPRRSKNTWPGWAAPGLAVLLLLAWLGYGLLRVPQVEALMAAAPKQEVAVVQGNIAQDLKWSPAMQDETLHRYEALSQPLLTGGRLVLWPETALPFSAESSPQFTRVREFVAGASGWLLTGAPTATADAGGSRYYNSALLLDPTGALAGVAHKSHLVPFGEYIPLRRLLFFLAPVVETLGDFTPGHNQPPLSAGASRIGVLICYESIFPEIARHWVADGANLLTNLTNDAWYGRSSAPWHSQAMAVLRAVETRRALARAANTGVSSLIDPLGRVVAFTPLFTPAQLSGSLPLLETRTFFVRWGHWFGPLCLLLALFGLVKVWRGRPAW
ncbi:MAG: apolipoprotein N-acyltransferase [Desulfobulbaceae bacterium A2]|nr:MAG: apolipoprotein N-acyltransferase [Desulfobulbaceae bacterium A2]